MIMLFACKKENTSPSPDTNVSPDTSSIEEINAPDGFNYESSKKVSFQLTTVNTTGEVVEKVIIKIMGINKDDETEQFYSNITNEQGILNIELNVGNHFESLQIVTNYQGIEKNNAFEITESIESSLVVD